jgi:hypothetical protein
MTSERSTGLVFQEADGLFVLGDGPANGTRIADWPTRERRKEQPTVFRFIHQRRLAPGTLLRMRQTAEAHVHSPNLVNLVYGEHVGVKLAVPPFVEVAFPKKRGGCPADSVKKLQKLH